MHRLMLLLGFRQSQILERLVQHGLVLARHCAVVVGGLDNLLGFTVTLLMMLHDIKRFSFRRVKCVGATQAMSREAGCHKLLG